MENIVSLKEIIEDRISCFDEEYAQELNVKNYTDEDIENIVENILDNSDFDFLVQNEIEEYFNRKKVK